MACCKTYKLNTRVEIQYKSSMPDGLGGNNVLWTKLKDYWVDFKTMSMSEQFLLMREENTAICKLVGRYDTSITNEMRIVMDSIPYEIVGLNNIEQRNKWLEIKALKGKNFAE